MERFLKPSKDTCLIWDLEGEVPNPSPVRVLAHIPPIPAPAPSPALEVANRNPLRALNEIFKFFKHLPVLKVPPTDEDAPDRLPDASGRSGF